MKLVIESQLFAERNTAPAEEQDLAASFSDAEIGVATMIHKFRTAPIHSAVNEAAAIQAKEIEFLRSSRPPGLIISDAKLPQVEALSSVLGHFSAARNRLSREDAEVMNSRSANPEGIPGKLGINKLAALFS